MGDALPKIGDRKDVTITCKTHGVMEDSSIFFGGEWRLPVCRICQKSEREAEEKAEREAQEKFIREAPQRRIESALGRSGIPQRHAKCRLGSYKPVNSVAKSILAYCVDYAENFPGYAEDGRSLIFIGEPGTGKTHLTCAIANHVIEHHGKTALFITAVKAIRHVKQTYSGSSKTTEQQAIDWFLTPDLLILDEVGVQFGTDTERNILFEILNDRYETFKPTILISNLDNENLKKFAGARVVDRMKENGGAVLKFLWTDSYRGKQNN